MLLMPRQAVLSGRLKVRKVRYLELLPLRRNVDTESLTAACESNRRARFQEACDPLLKFAHTNFDCGPKDLIRYS